MYQPTKNPLLQCLGSIQTINQSFGYDSFWQFAQDFRHGSRFQIWKIGKKADYGFGVNVHFQNRCGLRYRVSNTQSLDSKTNPLAAWIFFARKRPWILKGFRILWVKTPTVVPFKVKTLREWWQS